MITVIQSKGTFEDNLGAPENKTKRQKQDINNGRMYNTKPNEKYSMCLGNQETRSVYLYKSHLTDRKN